MSTTSCPTPPRSAEPFPVREVQEPVALPGAICAAQISPKQSHRLIQFRQNEVVAGICRPRRLQVSALHSVPRPWIVPCSSVRKILALALHPKGLCQMPDLRWGCHLFCMHVFRLPTQAAASFFTTCNPFRLASPTSPVCPESGASTFPDAASRRWCTPGDFRVGVAGDLAGLDAAAAADFLPPCE